MIVNVAEITGMAGWYCRVMQIINPNSKRRVSR